MKKINNLVIITDQEERIVWVNEAFTQFTGFSLQDSLNKNPGKLLWGANTDTNAGMIIENGIRSNEFVELELINYCKDGREFWVQLNVSQILNDNNEIEGSICVDAVITERKEKEKKIAEQNKALRKLAWMSTHEVSVR